MTASDPSCPFCQIVAHSARARLVMEREDVIAFLPDVPAVEGHTLVVPRIHVADILGLDAATASVLASATLEVAIAVRQAFSSTGLNVIQSNGASAGQTVPHVHVHVVPRHEGDRMPDLWPHDNAWDAGDLDAMQAAVRNRVTIQQRDLDLGQSR